MTLDLSLLCCAGVRLLRSAECEPALSVGWARIIYAWYISTWYTYIYVYLWYIYIYGEFHKYTGKYMVHVHIIIGIYGVHTGFLAGKSPYPRSYTVYIYSSGQP